MKKTFYIVLTLFVIFALSACGESDIQMGSTGTPSGTPSLSAPASDSLSLPEQDPTQAIALANCVFDPTLFNGKLQSCAYAGDGKLFVVADKLYLYDTRTASVLATTETPLSSFYVQTIGGATYCPAWATMG